MLFRSRRAFSPPRVVDQNIDRAKETLTFGDKPIDVIVARKIGGQGDRLPITGLNLFPHFVQLGSGSSSENYLAPGPGKGESDGPADTPPGPGNERNLAIEGTHDI